MSTNDNEIRAVFAPLRNDEPSRREVSEAVLRAGGRSAPRLRPRFALLAAGVAAAGLAAFALLPAGQDTAPTGPRAASGPFSLASAHAARQAERPGYRYTKVRIRIDEPNVDMSGCHFPPPPPGDRTDPDRVAAHDEAFSREMAKCRKIRGRTVREFVTEQWVDKELHGWVKASPDRVISGDRAGETFGKERSEPFMYGDVLLADSEGNAATAFELLPTEPAELEKKLTELVTRNARFMWSHQRDFEVTWAALDLLTYPQVSPKLRSATFGVLARINGFRDAGTGVDELGRRGHRMDYEAPYNDLGPGPGKVKLTVLFDTDKAELLSYTKHSTFDIGHEIRTTLIEQAASVSEIKKRP